MTVGNCESFWMSESRMPKAEQTLSQFVIKAVFRKTSQPPKVPSGTLPDFYLCPHTLPQEVV